jgi:DNA-binding transcriptional ArsR family regulator
MESIENLQIQAEEVAETLRLLAHPKRLLILCKLANGSCTV